MAAETPAPQAATRVVDRALTVAGRAKAADGRLAERTLKQYGAAFTAFEEWCRGRGRTAIPCTSETLADYAAALVHVEGYAVSTARWRITAILALHRLRGKPLPDPVPTWYVLRAAQPTPVSRRVGEVAVRRAALVAIADVCDPGRPADARNLCLASLAFSLYGTEQEMSGLNMDDVRVGPGDPPSGLIVRIGGVDLDVWHDDHDPVRVCPVEATLAWLSVLAANGADGGPLFRAVDKAGRLAGCGPTCGALNRAGDGRLGVRGLQRVWARMQLRAGLSPVPPRALRVGGAVEDVDAGVSLAVVLRRGRWSVTETRNPPVRHAVETGSV